MNHNALTVFLIGTVSVFLSCNGPSGQTTTPAQTNDSGGSKNLLITPNPQVDQSPMDMAYYPTRYPQLKMTGEITELPDMRLIYSRPQKKGREIFGGLLKYGEQWRLGANEASEIEFFHPVSIQGKNISAGRYVIYCIPQEKQWTIVLNSNLYSWGLHFDPTKDIGSFSVPVDSTRASIEFFTMLFEKSAKGANLVMAWDYTKAALPIEF